MSLLFSYLILHRAFLFLILISPIGGGFLFVSCNKKMGTLCSKEAKPKTNPYAGRITADPKNEHHQQLLQVNKDSSNHNKVAATLDESEESPRSSPARYSNASDDEFYDGIPRYRRNSFRKSRSLRGSKVSEVSSLLGRQAVEVLDTLGSSVSNLNVKGGFMSSAATKGNELTILAFEVANTIVKGSTLMQSLSKRSIRHLNDVVLTTEGVKRLISDDTDQLLRIVAEDKREELKIFVGEVIRFGNRCKDPQWHNLDRFFEKRSRDRTPQEQLRETAESVMLQLMTLVQLTAELYQEMHILDKIEENFKVKRLEAIRYNVAQRGGGDRDNSLNLLSSELKSQKKLVKNLKKKSMWSISMDEVMEKLVDIVLFLNQEINYTFGNPDESETPKKDNTGGRQTLGAAGIALHYANIILLIDSIVARSSSMPPNSRDTLYQNLPPNLKRSLRTKLHSFHVEKEMSVSEIKDEMEKTLHWLVQIATNTAKAHHGFGWVGEWANTTGSELNRRTTGPIDVMQVETLHHANKNKTEAYILDLLVWLNYLISRSNATAHERTILRSSVRSPAALPSPKHDPQSNDTINSPSSSNSPGEKQQHRESPA